MNRVSFFILSLPLTASLTPSIIFLAASLASHA